MTPVIDEKFLHGWQDQLLTTAKRILKTARKLEPYVWILTTPDRVPDSMRTSLRPLEHNQETWATVPRDTITIAVLPNFGGWEQLRSIVERRILNDEARAGLRMAEIIARASGLTREQEHRGIVRAFMGISKMTKKDIQAVEIKATLKDLNAIAYVKQDDGLSLHMVEEPGTDIMDIRRKYAADLADEPNSVECIMSVLEHAGGCRMLTQPYHRRQRLTGKVKSFGEAREVIVSRWAGGGLSGRFMWLLDFPAPEPAPIQPQHVGTWNPETAE